MDGKWHDAKAAAGALGLDEIVALPTIAPRPEGVDAGAAGSAFDLRARMILAAAGSAQTAGVVDLARFPTISEYPGASEGELRVFSDVFEAARRIVESGGSDDDLDRAAVLLSWCDAAYRKGPIAVMKGDLSARLREAQNGGHFAARVSDDLIADVAAIRTSGHLQLQQWAAAIGAGDGFTPNPQLIGRDIMVGAVPDWLIGDTLIECKTSEPVTASKLRDALLQLLGYVLLDLDDTHHIRNVGVWLPRRGVLRTWSLDRLLGADADVELPRLRATFQTLFGGYLRDWDGEGWVPGTVHPSGGFDEYVGKAFVHEWFRDGIRHREDGPAFMIFDSRWWYLDGELQRAVVDGAQLWYQNDQLHREDGPAVIEVNRTEMWCRNGQIHREDGPAVSHPTGIKHWWLSDRQYATEADWDRAKAVLAT